MNDNTHRGLFVVRRDRFGRSSISVGSGAAGGAAAADVDGNGRKWTTVEAVTLRCRGFRVDSDRSSSSERRSRDRRRHGRRRGNGCLPKAYDAIVGFRSHRVLKGEAVFIILVVDEDEKAIVSPATKDDVTTLIPVLFLAGKVSSSSSSSLLEWFLTKPKNNKAEMAIKQK